MKHLKRAAALVLAMILSVTVFAGCEVKMENNDSDTVAAVFEKENVYMDEAKLYVYLAQRQMEYSSQFMILYYYGGYDAFWDANWSYNLIQAMQEIYQTKLLATLAKEEGMALTEDEKTELARQKEKMMTEAETKKALDYAGADEKLVDRFMEENALATKYYLKLMEDVDTTFDKDAFRRKKLTGVSITAKSVKTEPTEAEEEAEPETEAETESEAEEESGEETEPASEAEANGPDDEDGEMNVLAADEGASDDGASESEEPTTAPTTEAETYSDEEKSANVKAVMEEILQKMKDGKTASEIVTEYQNDATVNVTTLSTVEVAPEDAREEGAEITEYKQLAWEMKTGETEGTVLKNSSGADVGYVLHSENDDDDELRKAAEDEELENRKKTLFAEKFEELKKKHPTFHVFQEKVANVKYKGSILGSITVTGDDFATLEETNDESGDGEAE